MSLVEKKLKLTTLPPLKIQACFLPESFCKTPKKRSEGDLKKTQIGDLDPSGSGGTDQICPNWVSCVRLVTFSPHFSRLKNDDFPQQNGPSKGSQWIW